jgi:putative tryptophan/tyrosine transport system substrate-binding protein
METGRPWSMSATSQRTGMSKSVTCFTQCALFLALCLSAEAQQSGKVRRIGYVSTTLPGSATHEAFRQGLRDFGYVEGKDIVIEWRHAEGNPDRLADLAAELVRLNVDIIVAPSYRGALAAKQLTKSIPIVMNTGAPIELGLVTSLARPGGNVTGVTDLAPDLGGKRLELLKEIIPRLTRVAVLRPAGGLNAAVVFREMESPAKALGLQLQSLEVGSPNFDFESAFESATRARAGALVVIGAPLFTAHHKRIADLALRHRLPSSHRWSDYAEIGGLMSYGVDRVDLYRRHIASYVDKILKGAKPADLPVQQPTKFELVINLKTARALDLVIPPAVLMEADKVIK